MVFSVHWTVELEVPIGVVSDDISQNFPAQFSPVNTKGRILALHVLLVLSTLCWLCHGSCQELEAKRDAFLPVSMAKSSR